MVCIARQVLATQRQALGASRDRTCSDAKDVLESAFHSYLRVVVVAVAVVVVIVAAAADVAAAGGSTG